MKNKRLFVLSLFCSLSLHLLALVLLQWSFLIVLPPQRTSSAPLVLSKEAALKEAFQSFDAHQSAEHAECFVPVPAQLIALNSVNFAPDFAELSPPLPLPHSFFHATMPHDAKETVKDLSHPFLRPPSFSSELTPLHLAVPTAPAPPACASLPVCEPRSHTEPLFTPEPTPGPQQVPSPAFLAQRGSDFRELSDTYAIERASLAIPKPLMPRFPTLEELNTSSFSDWFDFDLVYVPEEDQSGYLFALTLIPRVEMALSSSRQHYLFLIDRSNSIQKERLAMTKGAVLRALEELTPQDTFNIFVFDSKVEKLFPSSHKPDTLSLSLAKTFLNNISLGSFFSQANLYTPLALALPQHVAENELYNIILLSDGESLAKKGALQPLLSEWTEQAQGTVSLFTLNMSKDQHLPSLEALTASNRGWSLTSHTNRGLKRKLIKLMNTIRTPLAKDLAYKAISPSSHRSPIILQSGQSPHLYAGRPLVILGHAKTMDNFILFVQGRFNDRWLNIKKKVSFLNARLGNASLKKEWALQTSYQCYQRYFKEHDPAQLAEAKNVLASFDLTPLVP